MPFLDQIRETMRVMNRWKEQQRAQDSFDQALAAYVSQDVPSEDRLYAAAKTLIALGRRPEIVYRISARIAKKRWRRNPTEVEHLLEYLSYLSRFGWRQIPDDRILAAKHYDRVASILAALVPRPPSARFVNTMFSLCETAVYQHLLTERPALAAPSAELALRYARMFVLWDKRFAHLLVLPLRQVAKVAFANGDYPRVVEAQHNLLKVMKEWAPLDKQAFSLGEVQSQRSELMLRLEAKSASYSLAHWIELSDSERDALLSFQHCIPMARQVGEEYRLLGQAYSRLGATPEAIGAFDISIRTLRTDLASENNRLLALDVALEAITFISSFDRAAARERAVDAILEAEALKARGINVPQWAALFAQVSPHVGENAGGP